MLNNIHIASDETNNEWFMEMLSHRWDNFVPISVTEHLVLCLMGGEL